MATASKTHIGDTRKKIGGVAALLLVLSGIVYVAGFMHLRADFPNGSPWMDWSKMTDEGWYGNAAIHYFVQGSWYLPDSFNPAVAMPVWPAMLGLWFAITGVSMIAARALTMLLYGVSLVLLYRLAWRSRPGKLAAVVVLLTVINPFCYAFDRLAVLEPVTVFWMMLALWLAGKTQRENWAKQVLLGMLVFLLVLTKATGVALIPAVLYLMVAEWGWPTSRRMYWRVAAALAVVIGTAAVLWVGYMRLVVRLHYLADYRLLFSINAYRVHLSIVPKMAWVTLRDGGWINPVLFPIAVLVGLLSVVWVRELWRLPLFGASVIAIAGQLTYIGYHTNFQPRYYLVITMPLMLVIGLGAAAAWDRRLSANGKIWRWGTIVLAGVIVVTAVSMGARTLDDVLHPDYSFWEAAQDIAAVVDANAGADGDVKPMLLSDSGDDITLWTGVPAVTESYTTHGLDTMLNIYKPGWYAAWPGWEKKGMQQVGKRYRLQAVARYRVFDDPTRPALVLYQLTPK